MRLRPSSAPNPRCDAQATHARKIVTVEVDQTVFRILDSAGAVLTAAARTNTEVGPSATAR
jgi:hypothetical protein